MKKIISFILILILVFSLVSCKKTTHTPAADIDVATLEELDYKAQFVRANVEYTPNLPYTEVIHSKAELNSYIERFAVDVTDEFKSATQKYTDEFFNESQVVMCMIEETSGSIRHKVKKVLLDCDIGLDIQIKRDIPDVGTDDMATWHIFVETRITRTPDDRIEIIIDGKNKTRYKDISATKGNIGISLTLKNEFQYEIIDEDGRYGLSIWHRDYEGKTLDIVYRDIALGLCGTGLTSKTVNIGNYAATAYRYDDLPSYFMANFNTVSGGYYIENNGADIWWQHYEIEMLEALNTLVLSDISMTKEEALKIAKEQTTRDYTEEYINYDAQNGNWVVTLKNSEWTETYNISESGHSMTATQNQPAKAEPEQYDYSKEFDYFADGHDFWDGEGATLVSANCPQNDIKISLYIPKDWEYEAVDYSSDKANFGIYFWPKGEQNGKIYVCYQTDTRELGCGTGIDFKDIRLGNFDATVVTYVLNDVNPYMWNHIIVADKTNNVRIYSGDAYLWWHQNYETAIKIMSSLTVEQSVCTLDDAIEAVASFVGADKPESVGGEYDFEKNEWIITSLDKRYTVSADATVVKVME